MRRTDRGRTRIIGAVTLLPLLFALLLASPLQSAPPQEPTRVDPTQPATEKPVYRKLQKGEEAVEGLLQRVECPYGRPVIFTMRAGKNVERFESPQLADVDYIAHTPTFRGPMTCGGRGKGDLVRLTWRKAANTRRVVAIEFLPAK